MRVMLLARDEVALSWLVLFGGGTVFFRELLLLKHGMVVDRVHLHGMVVSLANLHRVRSLVLLVLQSQMG